MYPTEHLLCRAITVKRSDVVAVAICAQRLVEQLTGAASLVENQLKVGGAAIGTHSVSSAALDPAPALRVRQFLPERKWKRVDYGMRTSLHSLRLTIPCALKS